MSQASINNLNREELAHLQQLVRELVQGDTKIGSQSEGDGFDQTPYIVKQVFQGAKEDAFGEQLTQFVYRKEAEIEKVCSLHYQDFVHSIDQLLKVRAGTSSLRDKLMVMNQQVQEVGSKSIEKKKELIENRRRLLNIEYALECVQSCLFVLDICARVSIQISNRKYFSAIRMLQELHDTHLKLIQNYSFSKLICNLY